jgi:hypothetical protein
VGALVFYNSIGAGVDDNNMGAEKIILLEL